MDKPFGPFSTKLPYTRSIGSQITCDNEICPFNKNKHKVKDAKPPKRNTLPKLMAPEMNLKGNPDKVKYLYHVDIKKLPTAGCVKYDGQVDFPEIARGIQKSLISSDFHVHHQNEIFANSDDMDLVSKQTAENTRNKYKREDTCTSEYDKESSDSSEYDVIKRTSPLSNSDIIAHRAVNPDEEQKKALQNTGLEHDKHLALLERNNDRMRAGYPWNIGRVF